MPEILWVSPPPDVGLAVSNGTKTPDSHDEAVRFVAGSASAGDDVGDAEVDAGADGPHPAATSTNADTEDSRTERMKVEWSIKECFAPWKEQLLLTLLLLLEQGLKKS